MEQGALIRGLATGEASAGVSAKDYPEELGDAATVEKHPGEQVDAESVEYVEKHPGEQADVENVEKHPGEQGDVESVENVEEHPGEQRDVEEYPGEQGDEESVEIVEERLGEQGEEDVGQYPGGQFERDVNHFMELGFSRASGPEASASVDGEPDELSVRAIVNNIEHRIQEIAWRLPERPWNRIPWEEQEQRDFFGLPDYMRFRSADRVRLSLLASLWFL